MADVPANHEGDAEEFFPATQQVDLTGAPETVRTAMFHEFPRYKERRDAIANGSVGAEGN